MLASLQQVLLRVGVQMDDPVHGRFPRIEFGVVKEKKKGWKLEEEEEEEEGRVKADQRGVIRKTRVY